MRNKFNYSQETHSKRRGEILQNEIIRKCLAGLTGIMPTIHQLVISSDYPIKEIREFLENVSPPISNANGKNFRNYKCKAFAWFKGHKITIYYINKSQYGAACILVPSKDNINSLEDKINQLLEIDYAFPDTDRLNVMSIEFTIDFFCKKPEAVSNMFYLLRRYLHVPYCRRTNMIGGDFLGLGEPRSENSVQQYFMKAERGRSKRYVKIYERGSDGEGPPWDQLETYRTRLEFYLQRGNSYFHLGTLHDFILDSKFFATFYPERGKKLIQFKHFDKVERGGRTLRPNKQLPRYWQDYNASLKKGRSDWHKFVENLQEEIVQARRKNLSNTILALPPTEADPLMLRNSDPFSAHLLTGGEETMMFQGDGRGVRRESRKKFGRS